MTAPMDDRQKRAVIAVVSIFAGGIALIVLLIVLAGGDDTKSVNTASDRTTTSSSSTTLPPTTTTLALPTLPPTAPPTAPPTNPPTVIVIPPTSPPTSPPTAAPTSPPTTAATAPPSTAPTSPTTVPTPATQLAAAIETALNGGVPPDPGAPKRVKVTIPANPGNPDKEIDVDWDLDDSLTPAEQAQKAREEALIILKAIRDANLPGSQEIRVRGFVPDPDPAADPGDKLRVVRLIYERATIDGSDFPTYDDVFEEPPALLAVINPVYVPAAPPTTSTSSTTTTT